MTEPTREQLQIEIMEILYQKSLLKPVWISCAEIYWNITNLKVTERCVKDVLDWLVKNELVLYQADKYQIDKREFLDMTKKKETERKEVDNTENNIDGLIDNSLSKINNCHISGCFNGDMISNSKNTAYTIISLAAFLLCGTLVGILFFNTLTAERIQQTELFTLPDSIQVGQLKIIPPVYSRDTYIVNRNFKRIHNILEEQQRINTELLELTKRQQRQINEMTIYIQHQTSEIEQYEREHRIYIWMISIALLVLSSLFIYRHNRKS